MILKRLKYIVLSFLIAACLSCGHLAQPPKSSFVVFNTLDYPIDFSVRLDGYWNDNSKTPPNDVEYVLLYDDESKFTVFPKSVEQIKIIYKKCSIALDRTEILKQLKKDKDGRNSWHLYIDKQLLGMKKCLY